MPPAILLPYIDTPSASPSLIACAARLGHVLVSPSFDLTILPSYCNYSILCPPSSSPSVDEVTAWLDSGADRVILPSRAFEQAAATLPASRLVQSFVLGEETHKEYAGMVLLRTREPLSARAITAFQKEFAGEVLFWDESSPPHGGMQQGGMQGDDGCR